jgi:hypothetical protein
MPWFLLTLPLFIAGIWIGIAVLKKLSPPPPPEPDPVGLRTVARFFHEGGDPASLMDAVSEALEQKGFEVNPWRWDREGCYVDCTHGTTRFHLNLAMYGETTLMVTGYDAHQLPVGPPLDGTPTRTLLRALDGALRAHAKVRDLQWKRRELHLTQQEGSHQTPFDDA